MRITARSYRDHVKSTAATHGPRSAMASSGAQQQRPPWVTRPALSQQVQTSPAPARSPLPLLVGPVSVTAIHLSIRAAAINAITQVAAIGVFLAAALRAVMADRAANRGAKHAVVCISAGAGPRDYLTLSKCCRANQR